MTNYKTIGLLAAGVITYLVITGCAPIQGALSAAGGYLTKSEFDDQDSRLDSIETRVKSLERWGSGRVQ